jgi:hypothetical protein
LIVAVVQFQRGRDLLEVCLGLRDRRLRSGVNVVRDDDRGQQRDDGDDDHEFDERKTALARAFGTCLVRHAFVSDSKHSKHQ